MWALERAASITEAARVFASMQLLEQRLRLRAAESEPS